MRTKTMGKIDRKRPKIVLAGNCREHEIWCDTNRIHPRDYTASVYVHDYNILRGRIIASDDLIIFGSFWEREDARKIYDTAQERISRFEDSLTTVNISSEEVAE